MHFLRVHFQNYQKLRPLKFCLLITAESLVLSIISGGLIELFWGIPTRPFLYLPVKRLFILLVIFAPIIETLLFQTMPITVLKWLRANFVLQIALSALLFAAAHFAISWQVGISTGIVAGFYLAFTYAHWSALSHITAYWTTTLSHAIRNFIAFLIIIVSLPDMAGYQIQYDYFTNKNLGTVWHFYDKNENFLFAIVDTSLKERKELNKKPNTLFYSDFSMSYPDNDFKFRYDPEKNVLSVNSKHYVLTKYNVLFVDPDKDDSGLKAMYLNAELKADIKDILEIPFQIEQELARRKKGN